jgi:mannosyltransferase OCH1-like enzyme
MEEDNYLVFFFMMIGFIIIIHFTIDLSVYRLPSYIPRKLKVFDKLSKKEIYLDNLSFNNIPAKIHQLVDSKHISRNMYNIINNNTFSNIEFDYIFYDNNDCRNFIAENFVDQVLYAYDSLDDGPYKLNLCKYCILYTYGGIYLNPYYNINIKLIEYLQQHVLVFLNDKENLVSTNVMIAPPGLDIFRLSIEIIINLVNNNKVTKNKKYQLINSDSVLYSLIKNRNYTKYITLQKKNNNIYDIDTNTKIFELKRY